MCILVERGGACWNNVDDAGDALDRWFFLLDNRSHKTKDFKKTYHNSSKETALYIYIIQDIKN